MITGSELAEARRAAGLTQAALADRMNVSVRSIRTWEAQGVPYWRQEATAAALPVFRRSLGSSGRPADPEPSGGRTELRDAIAALEHALSLLRAAQRGLGPDRD